MKKKICASCLLGASLLLCSCGSHYELTKVSRTRILIDKRYDSAQDTQANIFLAPFKQKVDSIMCPVVGTAAKYLSPYRPESPLSNLLSDILVWSGKLYNEQPVLGVYNIGGMRAAFAQGEVTYGDVVEVAPFENKICFLTLKGDKLLELFSQISKRGGEGVSHGVELVINDEKEMVSVLLNGEEIDPAASYRVATIDYVAEGNDGMTAFKSATDINAPSEEKNNIRYIIMEYFREQAAAGNAVNSEIEGRITIK